MNDDSALDLVSPSGDLVQHGTFFQSLSCVSSWFGPGHFAVGFQSSQIINADGVTP